MIITPREMRRLVTRSGSAVSCRESTSTARSAAYDSSRFSPGFTGSISPSPVKVASSSTENAPPSSVYGVELVSHTALRGRWPVPAFHTDTRSASTGALMIGTSADWFLRIVTGSFRRYSNRSPSPRPSAATSVAAIRS